MSAKPHPWPRLMRADTAAECNHTSTRRQLTPSNTSCSGAMAGV